MSKKPSKIAKSKPKTIVKAPVKVKANGSAKTSKTLDESKLSKPMQAGFAAVAAMKPEAQASEGRLTKLVRISELLKRPEGATLDEILELTGWKKHTARAAISHALKKKHGYHIVSDKPKGGKRIYKITEPEQ